jgi:hypothetical protein
MPMTAFMSQIANALEARLRPGLAEFITREYRERSGNQEPTILRVKELTDDCMNRMRLKLEECYDLKITAKETQSHAMLAIRLALADALDKEFPKIILAS